MKPILCIVIIFTLLTACNNSQTVENKQLIVTHDSISIFNYSHLVRNQLKGRIKMIKDEEYYFSSKPEYAWMSKFPHKTIISYYDTNGFLTKITVTLYSSQSVVSLSKNVDIIIQKNDSLVETSYDHETKMPIDKYIFTQAGPMTFLKKTLTFNNTINDYSQSETLLQLDKHYRITEFTTTGTDSNKNVTKNEFLDDKLLIQRTFEGNQLLSTDTSIKIVTERDKIGNPTVYKTPEPTNLNDTVLTHVTYEYYK